jgi:hypothetical protein
MRTIANRWYGWCDLRMSEELESRVHKVEDEVFRQHPENPGLSMRLYRIEQLLSVMLKVGAALFACGMLWRLADLAKFLIGKPGTP